MFHIHNGDCSAEIAKRSSIPGAHLAWREALVEGPTPATRDAAEWRRLRAHHLSVAYGIHVEEMEKDLQAEEEQLQRFREHEEAVLWFEHDLFCQVNLIYLLDWFRRQPSAKTKSSLVCIGEFPGKQNFRGLGELNPEEMASLFPDRELLTQEHLSAGRSAWSAYSSRDPTDIQSLVETELYQLPFLRTALKKHLQRFPSTRNGLGRIENCALQLVASGAENFADLFQRFQNAEPIYGFGDAQFWLVLRRMTETGQPLLNVAGPSSMTTVEPTATFEITELGKSVLAGEADFVKINGINRWLGGVCLEDDGALWRWDEQAEKLVFG